MVGASFDSSTTFTRNPASQIFTAQRTNDAYAWTGAVNVDRLYTANGLNQYSDVAGTAFSHDANGNLTSDGPNIPELGMYYYKARMYSPTLGRFMQTDPIGYEDQINLYGYVGNDPVNLVDFDRKEAGSISYHSIQMLQQARIDNPRTPEELEQEKEFVVGVATLAITGGAILRGASAIKAYRAFYIAKNAKTGLTAFQTKSIARFFGKGLKGAEAALSKVGEKGFSLPKGVTAGTLDKYKQVAEKAIKAGKTPEVQRARIRVIDEALKKLKE